MIASTAYLELFLRSISEPALLRTFLRFLLLHRHDTHTILDTLVARIGSNSRVWPLPLSWLTWVSHLLSPAFVLGGCFCPSLVFVSSNHFKVRWHFLSSVKLLTILGTFSMCFPAFVISGYTQDSYILWMTLATHGYRFCHCAALVIWHWPESLFSCVVLCGLLWVTRDHLFRLWACFITSVFTCTSFWVFCIWTAVTWGTHLPTYLVTFLPPEGFDRMFSVFTILVSGTEDIMVSIFCWLHGASFTE